MDCAIVPGAKETLDHLRSQGLKIAINSGDERSALDLFLLSHRLLDKVDFAISGDEHRERPKPHAESILHICKTLNVSFLFSIAFRKIQTGTLFSFFYLAQLIPLSARHLPWLLSYGVGGVFARVCFAFGLVRWLDQWAASVKVRTKYSVCLALTRCFMCMKMINNDLTSLPWGKEEMNEPCNNSKTEPKQAISIETGGCNGTVCQFSVFFSRFPNFSEFTGFYEKTVHALFVQNVSVIIVPISVPRKVLIL